MSGDETANIIMYTWLLLGAFGGGTGGRALASLPLTGGGAAIYNAVYQPVYSKNTIMTSIVPQIWLPYIEIFLSLLEFNALVMVKFVRNSN